MWPTNPSGRRPDDTPRSPAPRRTLPARVGHPHCPKCGREITSQTVEQIVDAIKNLPADKRMLILSPLVKDRKGEYQAIFDDLRKQGYVRVRVDKKIYHLSETITLDKNKKHNNVNNSL